MSPFLLPVNLIRYFIGWRVNRSIVWLHDFPAVDTARVLGTIIGKRLSTQAAGPWQKAIAPLEDYFQKVRKTKSRSLKPPEIFWPVEASLFFYPDKLTFGKGERIFWELTLYGTGADHGFFLEVILPAMEEAGYTSDFRKYYRNALWGSFDIDCIYAAHGTKWQPVVQNGQLDLRYEPNPTQWLDGLYDPAISRKRARRLTWLTPFDFSDIPFRKTTPEQEEEIIPVPAESPTLQMILQAFLHRAGQLLRERRHSKVDIDRILREEERPLFLDALEKAGLAVCQQEKLQAVHALWPGQRIGTQLYKAIHPKIIRYLQLASILGVGKQTLYGCGKLYLS
jgi:hypothetical protein